MSFLNSDEVFFFFFSFSWLVCLGFPPTHCYLISLGPPQLVSFSPGSLLIPKGLIVLGHSKHWWSESFSDVDIEHGNLPGGRFFCSHKDFYLGHFSLLFGPSYS